MRVRVKRDNEIEKDDDPFSVLPAHYSLIVMLSNLFAPSPRRLSSPHVAGFPNVT